MGILLLLLLLLGGVWLTDLLAYLPLSLIAMIHLPRWLCWLLVVGLVAGLMGDGPRGPTAGDHRPPWE
ncbi:MAG: hypothetical protein WBA10_18975 [Elainellaceae cyanobacterium]